MKVRGLLIDGGHIHTFLVQGGQTDSDPDTFPHVILGPFILFGFRRSIGSVSINDGQGGARCSTVTRAFAEAEGCEALSLMTVSRCCDGRSCGLRVGRGLLWGDVLRGNGLFESA